MKVVLITSEDLSKGDRLTAYVNDDGRGRVRRCGPDDTEIGTADQDGRAGHPIRIRANAVLLDAAGVP